MLLIDRFRFFFELDDMGPVKFTRVISCSSEDPVRLKILQLGDAIRFVFDLMPKPVINSVIRRREV